MPPTAIAIVGAGRVGLTLGRALSRAGYSVTMLTRGGQAISGGLTATASWSDALHAADIVIVAVPDDAIAGVAAQLAAFDRVRGHHVVLHCSGMHGRSALASLVQSGAALGSLHPLMTFTAAAGEPELLRDTPAAVEGDPRAVAAARGLAIALGMSPVVELTAEGKRRYHAGAVFAANFLVVLAAVAERLARDAGAGDAATSLYLPLMQRAIDNVRLRGASQALSGPVSRGDAGTVAAHLAALEADDGDLYATLSRQALKIATERGLDAEAVRRVSDLLDEREAKSEKR